MRPVGEGILAAAPPLFIEDMDLAVAVHDDKPAGPALYRIEIHELDDPVMSRLQRGVFFELCRTADMECPHGQLRSGLTDGLGRNNFDRLADVDNRP